MNDDEVAEGRIERLLSILDIDLSCMSRPWIELGRAERLIVETVVSVLAPLSLEGGFCLTLDYPRGVAVSSSGAPQGYYIGVANGFGTVEVRVEVFVPDVPDLRHIATITRSYDENSPVPLHSEIGDQLPSIVRATIQS